MKRFAILGLASALLAACDSPSQSPPAPAALAGNAEQGRTLYAQSCAECHGADARGTDKGPPFIHNVYKPSHHADIAFVLAAKQGVRAHHWPYGDMPPRPEVNDAQVRDIVAWIRQEQRKADIE